MKMSAEDTRKDRASDPRCYDAALKQSVDAREEWDSCGVVW